MFYFAMDSDTEKKETCFLNKFPDIFLHIL